MGGAFAPLLKRIESFLGQPEEVGATHLKVMRLDHRVVELAIAMPLDRKIQLRSGRSKVVLKQAFSDLLPPPIKTRPKMGFGVPIDQWLRGALKDWADDLLNPSTLRQGGLLKPEPIAEKWVEHQTGTRNWQYFLWNVLMFEAWHEANRAPKQTSFAA